MNSKSQVLSLCSAQDFTAYVLSILTLYSNTIEVLLDVHWDAWGGIVKNNNFNVALWHGKVDNDFTDWKVWYKLICLQKFSIKLFYACNNMFKNCFHIESTEMLSKCLFMNIGETQLILDFNL